MRHVYIKPRSSQLNGKAERSHRTDQEEFYQLLTYTDDVDLNAKLREWEKFYNLSRPHGAHNGETPYEALKHLLGQQQICLEGSGISHSRSASPTAQTRSRLVNSFSRLLPPTRTL